MKTIKIFLASSSELKKERNAFGNFIRQLDDIYESRGMRIQLIKWEFPDAADNNKRRQDEYIELVRNSDMFIALLNRKVELYTREKLEVALEESKKKGFPKIYVFCKACNENDTEELKNLKEYLNEKGCFWYNFENLDNLQMQFVLQLMLYDNLLPHLNVEDGNVRLGEIEVAKMDHLTFMVNNEQYQLISKRLAELPKQIAIARKRAKKYPDDKSFRDDLQRMLNEFNRLKETMKQEQNFLLETALRISKLQGEKITGRMQRAITAFEDGNVHKANTILDEAEKDDKNNLNSFRQNRVTEEIRQIFIQSIEELLQKISIAKSNTIIPIEERITQIKDLYQSADQMAMGIGYEKEKYAIFLLDYARFLYDYADYSKAKEVYLRQISISEKVFGVDYSSTATSYNSIAGVYKSQGNYDKALEYYRMALEIRERTLGKAHPDTATSYNDIGLVYYSQGDYDKALDFCLMAMKADENALGQDHPSTARDYNSIAGVYKSQGNYGKALEYYRMALEIRERMLGKAHPDTATSYNDIGLVYDSLGEYDKALEYNRMALAIREKTLGKDHPDTANSYNNIGKVYYRQGDYETALEYYRMALEIHKKALGKAHPDTAIDYNNIGLVYNRLGDYNKALEYLQTALEIDEKVLGKDHPDTAIDYNNIGMVHKSQGDYETALKYLRMALEIKENAFEEDHPSTATSYNNIGLVYFSQGDYHKALEYYRKALVIREKAFGNDHPDTANSYNNIAGVYKSHGDYSKALKYYRKALAIREKVLGNDHPSTANSYNIIAGVYYSQGDYDKALEYYQKAQKVFEKSLGIEHPKTLTLQQVIDNLQHIIEDSSKSTTNYDKIKQDRQPLTYIIPDKDNNLISIDLNQMWFDGKIEKDTIDLFNHVLFNPEYFFTDWSNNKKDNDFWIAFYGTQNLDKEPDYIKEVNDIPNGLKSIYVFLAYILMRKDAYDLLCDSHPDNLRGDVHISSKNSDRILFNALDLLHNNKTLDIVSYNNSKALRSPEFGKCLKRLLYNRLINKYSVYYPNIQFNDDVFYKICTELGYEQVLGIKPETFRNWLEGRLYVEYINEVRIKDFLCIDEISIKFNESKEVYFLGENGDGKTLILYAIYLAFAGNRIEESLPEAGIAIALLRDAMNRKAILNGLDIIKTTYGPDQTTEMRKIYAYGTHRGRVNSIDNAEKYGFMTLFDANQTLVNPSEWIKDFCFREMMSQSEKSDSQSPIDISDLVKKRKKALQDLFNKILDKKVSVEFDDQDNYKVKYIENGAKLTFEQLSEGYRTTIIFICDLLYRLFEQRPKDDIIHGEEATGVVLIDEIDEHLHPRWQRSIVSRLRSLFPNIQFIFTTHSPHIIQGAGQDAVIYRLYRNKDGKTCASDPFYRKDLDFMMMNTLTTSPLFSMGDARLDSNNGDADTSDSYLMYRIEQLVTEEIKDIRDNSKEDYMSPQEIDELIKKAKEKFLSTDSK